MSPSCGRNNGPKGVFGDKEGLSLGGLTSKTPLSWSRLCTEQRSTGQEGPKG